MHLGPRNHVAQAPGRCRPSRAPAGTGRSRALRRAAANDAGARAAQVEAPSQPEGAPTPPQQRRISPTASRRKPALDIGVAARQAVPGATPVAASGAAAQQPPGDAGRVAGAVATPVASPLPAARAAPTTNGAAAERPSSTSNSTAARSGGGSSGAAGGGGRGAPPDLLAALWGALFEAGSAQAEAGFKEAAGVAASLATKLQRYIEPPPQGGSRAGLRRRGPGARWGPGGSAKKPAARASPNLGWSVLARRSKAPHILTHTQPCR